MIYFVLLAGLFLSSPNPQKIQHEVAAINIEVPVRVFKGDTFIDHLTLKDFEVYEDGVLQKVEAVYLIKKVEVQREENKEELEKRFSPEVARNFIFFFEVVDWLPKINDLIDHFFYRVYQPGDSLIITTPVKTYQLKKEALEKIPREKICGQLKGLLRKDILKGNMEYKSIIRDLISLDRVEDGWAANIEALRADLFRSLRDYKDIDEGELRNILNILNQIAGQKHIFIFYQKEEVPIPPSISKFDELRHLSFDLNRIKQAFADSSITTHFLFLTNDLIDTLDIEQMAPEQATLADFSTEVFSGFHEIAKTTGGVTYASGNPAAAFERASNATENYYLLYYAPKDYKADGQFRSIKVSIQGDSYRVLYRAGYVAD